MTDCRCWLKHICTFLETKKKRTITIIIFCNKKYLLDNYAFGKTYVQEWRMYLLKSYLDLHYSLNLQHVEIIPLKRKMLFLQPFSYLLYLASWTRDCVRFCRPFNRFPMAWSIADLIEIESLFLFSKEAFDEYSLCCIEFDINLL